MTDNRHISAEVPEPVYDRFQEIKEAVGEGNGPASNRETIKHLTDRHGRRKRPRPDVLFGSTQRIDTGHGKVYVNINHDESLEPFEMFLVTGDSGGYSNAFTEALAKLASLCLRCGVDPELIADELTGIRMPKIGLDNGDDIYSIPDAAGIALLRFLENPLDQDAVDPIRGTGNGELGVED